MDAAQWPQEMVHASMEDMVSSSTRPPQAMEKRVRPQKDQAINCPRCNSTNTKFCYYNNYSPTQPRYFCKACRRYWTEGGTLRNVPVGGGSRKNKRSSLASSSTNPKKLATDTIPTPNPRLLHQGHDLNMVFPSFQPKFSGDYTTSDHVLNMNITNTTTTTTTTSTTDALRSGLMSPFAPMPMVQESGGLFQSGGFGLQDFRSNLSYHHPVDGSVGGSGGEQDLKESNGGRLLFPFEDLRQNGSDHFDNQSRAQGGDSSVFWNEVMGGGATW